MKGKKWPVAIIAALIFVTAVLAVIHLTGRDNAADGMILLNDRGEISYIDPEQLSLTDVAGTTVNGKGEEKRIEAKGVPLDVVTGANFDMVTVTADDAYTAQVGAEEFERAYLIVDDGALRLIVFGDANAKRDVKHIVRIDVE